MARTKSQAVQSRATFLRAGRQTQEKPNECRDITVLPAVNKPTLRPRKPGLSLKEPDTDISDLESPRKRRLPKQAKVDDQRKVHVVNVPKMAHIKPSSRAASHPNRRSKACKPVTFAPTESPASSSQDRINTSAPGNGSTKCGCERYSSRCRECRSGTTTARKNEYTTAQEGRHYAKHDNKVFCKVPPCKNRVFKTLKTFGNHVFKKHGLLSAYTSRVLYALDSDQELKRQEHNARRRKQPGDSVCYNYYGARGSMRKRWSQEKYRMRATMEKRYLTKYEENLVTNPCPVVPKDPIFIRILELTMPSRGYRPWDCLCSEKVHANFSELVLEAGVSGFAVSCAQHILSELEKGLHDGLGKKVTSKLRAEATLLETTFDETHDDVDNKVVWQALEAHREHLCEGAVEWLQKKQDSLIWEKTHGLTKYENLALATYKAWKVEAKPRSCLTTLPNLVRAYMLFSGCNEAEAIVKVQKDSVWVDTSDEDEPEPNPREENGDESPIAPEVVNEKQALAQDSAPAPEELKDKEAVSQENGAPEDVKENEAVGEPFAAEESSQPRAMENTVAPAAGDRVYTITNLDELTNTQVLFGHGSYDGITLSQPSPVTKPSSTVIAKEDICISLNTPSPEHSKKNCHTEGDIDSNCEAAIGLCSMSQNPAFALPEISDFQTPTCQLFRHLMQSSASPDQEAGEKNKSTHNILVNAFSDWLHQLASPNSEVVPHSILESQEVSHAFNSTTPFVELMLAETQPSTPFHKIKKLLAEVDTRISTSNGKDQADP